MAFANFKNFKAVAEARYGNLLTAWRYSLDPGMTGEVGKMRFMIAGASIMREGQPDWHGQCRCDGTLSQPRERLIPGSHPSDMHDCEARKGRPRDG